MARRIRDTEWHGEAAPYATRGSLLDVLFSTPFQHVPNADPARYPDWTFDGQPIPPQRPLLVHDGTGAVLSRARALADAQRVARSIYEIIGRAPAPYPSVAAAGPGGRPAAVWTPESTVALHVPNCLAFPVLMLGATAARCTVSPLSALLQVPELAYVLARARPRIIVTTKGADQGEGKMRAAVQSIVDAPQGAPDVSDEARAWAADMARDWDAAAQAATAQRGELLPLARQRVWLVDLAGGADYYGSGFTRGGAAPAAQLDARDWTNLLRPLPGQADAPFALPPMEADELRARAALLLWSSGTTGKSKGVLLSHQALIADATAMWNMRLARGVFRGDYGGGERWISLAPWCHIYGLATLLLAGIAIGATIVLPATPGFDLQTYLKLVEKYRATFAHVAPPVLVGLKNTPLLAPGSGVDLSSVKGFGTGGAPIPPQVCLDVAQRTGGKHVLMGYGATEVGSITNVLAPAFPAGAAGSAEGRFAHLERQAHWGSTGVPLANKHVRIAPAPDSDADAIAARYEEYRATAERTRAAGGRAPASYCAPGEIQVRAPTLMLGYLSGVPSTRGSALDEALTRDAFTPDGWYRTGDEGVFDAQGHIWITGRIKELIKTKGGFQCSPPEVEACFAQHPAVAEGACVGVWDEADAAEFPLLYVVPKDAALLSGGSAADAQRTALVAQLAAFCTERLTFYKWPKAYAFVDAVPKNAGGKVVRKDLQALAKSIKTYTAPRHRQKAYSSAPSAAAGAGAAAAAARL